MATITFKGISAAAMGMWVQQMPDMVRAKRRVKRETVPGRSGALHIDGRAYDPITLKVVLNANGARLDDIHEWLSGSGDLILSDDPTKRCKAIADAEVKSSRQRTPSGRIYDSVTATFECDPYRYEADPEVYPLLGAQSLYNPGTAPAEPLIVVQGSGRVVLSVGDCSIILDELNQLYPITIDCDAKSAFRGSESYPVEITLADRDWPVLGLGNTRIAWTGTARVTVTPNWRWL